MLRSFELDCQWRALEDGRTVEGRVVPYETPARVIDREPDGSMKVYLEQFLKRSCLAMAQGIKRRGNGAFLPLLMDHRPTDFHARVGYCLTLEDQDDGAWGTFRLYEGQELEKVTSMLRESHTGLSVSFQDMKPPKLIDGVMSRVQVHLEHVAATPTPAYAGAGISGIRATELEPATPLLDEVNAWLASMEVSH